MRSFESYYDVPQTRGTSTPRGGTSGPGAMGYAGAASSVIQAIGDIYVQKENEKARKIVLESNARIADMLAEDARKRGHEEEAKVRMSGKKRVGSTRAALAAQGIRLTGDVSAQDVVQEDMDMTEINALIVLNNASREALGHHVEGISLRSQSKLETIRGKGQRAEIIGGGISKGISYYDMWRRNS